jgi:transcriptional regulator with GAF, ATPase, and Fis domain
LLSLFLITCGLIVVAYQRRGIDEKISKSETLTRVAKARIMESEGRFNAVLERATESIYCFEFKPPIPVNLPVEAQVARSLDAELVVCNMAFARALGKATRDEPVGMRLRDMRSMMSPEAHAVFHREFVEQGYRLDDYEFNFLDEQGHNRLLLVNVTGDIENGALVRLWGSDRNISEQTEIRKTLVGRLKFQEFIARISSRLLLAQADEVRDALVRCLEDICNHLQADRITIGWMNQDEGVAEPIYYWNETGDKPWKKLSLEDYPLMTRKLMAGGPVIINSIAELAKESEVDANNLAMLGLKSLAAVPLVVDGQVLGVCTIGDIRRERTWDKYNLTDLQTLADLIANVVYRIKANAALSEALVEVRSMKDRLEAENIYLRQEIDLNHSFDELIGQSDNLRHCLQQVQQVAATPTAVLVQGETGTGKELIVRAIHQIGDRNDRPLVKVNCAALPANLIESELFGHEKGAFTGATSRKRGRFDLAHKGTIFLDEIGDFPIELQGKLLRVLQEGEFQRVGGTETLKVDVRLIAATNRDLQVAVDSGEFRADLFYRISVYPIELPPLRERKGDVRLLAEHFVHKHAPGLGKQVTAISALMMEQLEAHSWPGNVRELESVFQRALISTNGPVLHLADALGAGSGTHAPDSPLSGEPVDDLLGAERAHIEKVLDQAGWVVAGGTGAAVKLGVPPSTLRSKMKKLGIHRPN